MSVSCQKTGAEGCKSHVKCCEEDGEGEVELVGIENKPVRREGGRERKTDQQADEKKGTLENDKVEQATLTCCRQ